MSKVRAHVVCDTCLARLPVDPRQVEWYGWSDEDHGWTTGAGRSVTCPDCWDDTPAEQWEVTTPPAVYASDDEPGWVR